jgi:putative colanic acid biosynthesis glycosyltransferase
MSSSTSQILNARVAASTQSSQPAHLARIEGGRRVHGLHMHGTSSQPLVSIITVVRNGAGTIEKAILSILAQTYSNIEYIIVDGQSTDGTLDILQKYNDRITYWISEADCGLYDAMNKGIDLCTGTWLLFVGADDELSRESVIETFSKSMTEDVALLLGNTEYSNGKIINSVRSPELVLHNVIQHQSAFYHKALFNDFHYDTQLKINSDYELNLLAFLQAKPWRRLNITVSRCEVGGVSTNINFRRKGIAELNLIRSRHVHPVLNFFASHYLNIRLTGRLILARLGITWR